MKFTIAIFFLTSLCYVLNGVHSARITFKNNCPYEIWPSGLTNRGEPLVVTGFNLEPTKAKFATVPAPWEGKFWARTGCSTDASGIFKCETADCASGQMPCHNAGGHQPATVVEFALDVDNNDFYGINLVVGFNLPVSIISSKRCKSAACKADINKSCPPELAVKGSNGNVIACKSACLALGDPQSCCIGNYSKKCPPTNYSQILKTQCPQAWSHVYESRRTFTCPTGGDYIILFCP